MKHLTLLVALAACRPVMAPNTTPPKADPTSLWSETLSKVVTPDGMVDYDLLEAEREHLDAYVAWIARPRRVARDNPQHAFWLNAYNALVMYAVLEDGRPASVLDVSGWLPRPGSRFFFERAFIVQGQPTSLWEIEHERLRGRTMDIRDHAAMNCASASCPPLRPSVYRATQLDKQLKEQMAIWMADEARGVRVRRNQAWFSPIFQWFAHDFSFFTAGDDLCTTAARFSEGDRKDTLEALAEQGCPHGFFEYDWSLNDASTP